MHFMRRALSSLCFSLMLAAVASGQESRAALVIGNGAYSANPLSNPVNDATDMAEALKAAGFDVLLRTDADYAGIDQALNDFQRSLKGKDVALFYYAGHGVQVDGENFLIPVKENIGNSAQAKTRGIALADVIGRIRETGVQTALVFLDACRDNPFPGSSRSGTRGLAVITAPRDMETLIAYATQPGDVAQDGSGRNGVFTAALLKNIGASGKPLGEVMTQVIADVKAATGGKQQPRVDIGLSRSFYFNDPVVAAARAQSAAQKSQAELAGLDAQVAALQSKIAAAKDASAKAALEVEQQKQLALQAAKRLEADGLAREAARQKTLAEQARQAALAREAALKEAQARQAELGNLAAAKRAELERLAQAAASDNPDILIDTLERLAIVLADVDSQYAAALAKSLSSSNAAWDLQLAVIAKEEPDITETDAMFEERKRQEREAVEIKRQAELVSLKAEADRQRLAQTVAMREQFESTLKAVQSKVWTLRGSGAVLMPGAFDRNARAWPFAISSADPFVPMLPVILTAELGKAADPIATIRAVDAAVKAQALAAEIDWGLVRDAKNKRYFVELRALRVRNLATGDIVVESKARQNAAVFSVGQRDKPQLAVATLMVTATGGAAEVWGNGIKLGMTPLTLQRQAGLVQLDFRWSDESGQYRVYKTASLDIAKTVKVEAARPLIPMVDVEGGSYEFSAPDRDGKSRATITLSPFRLGRTELTQAQWKAVMGKNPSDYQGDLLPVENIRWEEAVDFCNALSKREGKIPAYLVTKIADGSVVYSIVPGSDGYRLPTEAQWEWAARGGAKAAGNAYAGSPDPDSVAWHSQNSENKTRPVATRAPNELGLYDLSGNVWEMCWDRYLHYWPKGSWNDPAWEPGKDNRAAARGGSFRRDLAQLNILTRMDAYSANWSSSRSSQTGFRVAAPVLAFDVTDAPPRPWLGLTYTEKQVGSQRGIMVVNVLSGGSLERVGIQAGDVITQLAGAEARTEAAFSAIIAALEIGKPVELSFLRGATGQKKLVAPMARPRDSDLFQYGTWPGFSVAPDGRGKGLTVSAIQSASTAERTGLRSGDIVTVVNGKSVKTPEEFYAALALQSDNLKIRYLRDDSDYGMDIPRRMGGN